MLKNQNDDGGFCWAKRESNFFKLLVYCFNLKLLFNLSISDFLKNGFSKIKRIVLVCLNKEGLWRYSGLTSMTLKTRESDLFSTWFRLNTLALIEKTFLRISKNKESFKWNMKRKCGLGFYKHGKKK